MSKMRKMFKPKSSKKEKLQVQWTREDDEILEAVDRNDTDRLRNLLTSRKGVKVDRIDPKGHTAIHRAALKGSLNVMHVMLETGANVTVTDAQGRIPLHDACRMGQSEMAELLIQQQPGSKNTVDKFSLTPLHMACMHGKRGCVQLLLRHNVAVDPTDKEERTPLFYAARQGHVDICKMLVTRRANYNARDAKRKTPLMVAVECNRQDVCEYLVEAGADVNLYDAAGRDAMLYAAEKKDEDIMRTLQRAAGAGHNLDDDRTDSGAPEMYEEIQPAEASRRDTGFSENINTKSNDMDKAASQHDTRRSEDDVRKFSSGSVISSSGTGEVYSELNGDESGDIVPWDDAMKSDMEKVMAAARLKASNHGNERPLVGVVSSNDDGHVEGIMYAGRDGVDGDGEYAELEAFAEPPAALRRAAGVVDLPDGNDHWEVDFTRPRKHSSASSSSSSNEGHYHRPHLVQVKQVGEEETGSDAVIRLERASPQNPDIVVQWVDQDAFGEVEYSMPYHTDGRPQHEEDFGIPWPKDSASESSRRSSGVIETQQPVVLQPPAEFLRMSSQETGVMNDDVTDADRLHRRIMDLESEVLGYRQALATMEMDAIRKYHALQDDYERQLATHRVHIETLEATNISLEHLLNDKGGKTQGKVKVRRASRSGSSSSSSSDEEDKDKTKRLKQELREMHAEVGRLRHENQYLNEKVAILVAGQQEEAGQSHFDPHQRINTDQLLLQVTELENFRQRDREELEAATRRDEEMKLIIAKLEEDKRLLQKELVKTSAAHSELARQKSRDRGDGSLTQRDFDVIKSELAEATAAKEELYEQLCDTQMQLLDRAGEKERLEHQLMALEKILQKTVAEKEELEQKVKDAEDERESLKNKMRLFGVDEDGTESEVQASGDLEVTIRHLRDDNDQLTSKVRVKAAEVEELFKRVEELEEENYALRGQLERIELPQQEGNEGELKAVSASFVRASPQPLSGIRNETQVEEVLEENRRFMDEITELQAKNEALKQTEVELSDRCRGLEDKHEHVQDSLENLRSLLVIISSRPKVKGDAQLTADLVQASASVAALCETSEDDPGRRALEEFLADYSRLQDEREEIEKQMAALTDDSDHLRKKNKKLEAVVEELRDALEDAGDNDSRKVQTALATAHGVESKQLKEELEHLKVQYQAVSEELKVSKDEIEKLRSNVNQSAPLDQASSNEQALQMKIEDLERIVRNQDKLLEDIKRQESARMSERQKLEEDMEQLQLKNVTLLEKVAEIDMKPPLRRRESQDKALKEMQEELTKSKQELKEKGERYAKEKAEYEKSIAELKKNVEKLEKANAKHKTKGGKSTDDADEGWKKVVAKLESTNKTLLADISKLKNENERGRTDLENVEIANKKLLAEEVQKLRRLEAEKGRDRSPERDDKKTLKKQIDNLVAEKERLEQENEQLKRDLDQVASMFEGKQGQSLSQPLSPNASWSGDSIQLSEYALMIRLKLQELKRRSCEEASRLREDNQRLKDELEHFHKLSQHIVATKDDGFQKDEGLDKNRDVEVTLFPQTVVDVQVTPSSQSDSRSGSRSNDVDEQLRRENAELKTEISALRRRLADLEAKYKETAELAERKTAEKLQSQSQESRDAKRVELLESKNRELEAEVTTLAKSLKRLQRQNDRLSANLVDDRLAQTTSTSTQGQPVSIDEKHKQLTEENMMLRKKLRVLEERLADCAESSSGGGGLKMNTDKNNNSETSRLRKQLEESEKQHREIVNTYRTHLLAAVQGTIDPMVQEALRQIIRIKTSRPGSRNGSFRSLSEASPSPFI